MECIQNFTSEIDSLQILPEKNNISKHETLAIKELKSNTNIVIKKADKGSATVIMDKASYLLEGYRQLNNTDNYLEISEPIYHMTAIKIKDIVRKLLLLGLITDKQSKFLSPPQEPRPRYFYMLPKIHKAPESWTIPGKMPPGRPIVSDCNSVSKNVAGYVDSFLKPYAVQHPSYIKDTYDFVDKISKLFIPDDCFLATLDVESMYTNIDHELGIQSVKDVFPHLNPPFDSIIELLELTLKSNDFVFDGKCYLQVRGTAMGVDYAPHYSDIFMAKFEKDALDKCPFKPHTYFRFLDDVFIVWQHGHSKFQEFLSILNTHSPPIRFKAEVHESSVDYLDTTVFKDPTNNHQLWTKVFFKPTDTHQLLHKQSFHPKHTFKGILKSQITRFFRICSREIDFERAWCILSQSLRHRKYSRRWLRSIKSDTFKQLKLKQHRQQPTNPGRSSSGCKPCLHPRCETCNIVPEICSNFISTRTKNTYSISGNFDCSSSNLVYVMQCVYCNMQYVGETGQTLRIRMNRHKYAIETGEKTSSLLNHLLEHWRANSNKVKFSDIHLDGFLVFPIEQISDMHDKISTTLLRRSQETYWIDTLCTMEPHGLNKRREYDLYKPQSTDSQNIPFVIPFSRTAHETGNIVKKHLKILKDNDDLGIFNYDIIMAYSKHKTIGNHLISSKS